MAKRLPVQSVVCPECSSRFDAAPVLSFLGLPRFQCPQCTKKFLYPLSDRRRKAYVGIVVVFGLLAVGIIVGAHAIPIPGILPVGVGVGLAQDEGAKEARRHPSVGGVHGLGSRCSGLGSRRSGRTKPSLPQARSSQTRMELRIVR